MNKIILLVLFLLPSAILSENYLHYVDVQLKDGTYLTIPKDQIDIFNFITKGIPINNFPQPDSFIEAISFIAFADTKNLSQIYEKSFYRNIYACLNNKNEPLFLEIGFIDNRDTQLKKFNETTMIKNVLIKNKLNDDNELNKLVLLNPKNTCGNIRLDKSKIKKGQIIVEAPDYHTLIFDSDYLIDKNVSWITLRMKKK